MLDLIKVIQDNHDMSIQIVAGAGDIELVIYNTGEQVTCFRDAEGIYHVFTSWNENQEYRGKNAIKCAEVLQRLHDEIFEIN